MRRFWVLKYPCLVLDLSVTTDRGPAIVRAQLADYRLRLRQTWKSFKGQHKERLGWLVKLTTEDGASGYGDCAPLAEMGTEGPSLSVHRLRHGLRDCVGLEPTVALDNLPAWCDAPAARCALESALIDLISQRAGVPLARWLNPNAGDNVRVNAVIGALDAGVELRTQQALDAGFQVLKLKLGLRSFPDELKLLASLAALLPSRAMFRLDSNGSWNDAEAQEVIRMLHGMPIESLEEPLCGADPHALRRLQSRANWPLALDESLRTFDQEYLLANSPVRRLVLKPMVLGGLLPALRLAYRARSKGVETVVTTTVDSAIGVTASLHLAAALDTGLAHGLDTGSWLLNDVADGPVSRSGQMAVYAASGLGLQPTTTLCFT